MGGVTVQERSHRLRICQARRRQRDSSDDSKEAAACCHFLCLPSEGRVSNVENHLNSD